MPNAITITKVPGPTKKTLPPQHFPRQPIMYLELLENKDKIRKEFLNKDYHPPSHFSPPPPHEVKEFPKTSEIKDVDSKSDTKEEIEDKDKEDVIEERLKRLLQDEHSPVTSSHHHHHSNHHSHHHSKEKYTPPPPQQSPSQPQQQFPQQQTGLPPRLSDIQSGIPTAPYYPNANKYNAIEDEDAKREMLFKFDMLRRSYPMSNVIIPEYTQFSSLEEMTKTYDSTVRKLSIDSSVDSYKKYLVFGFMITEYVCANYLGFDMTGFTNQQIASISSYDRLLIEIGEKNYLPSGGNWPVEVRLFGMIVMNAAIFIVSKMFMDKSGLNILSKLNSMTMPPPPAQKRKMAGPNINLNSI